MISNRGALDRLLSFVRVNTLSGSIEAVNTLSIVRRSQHAAWIDRGVVRSFVGVNTLRGSIEVLFIRSMRGSIEVLFVRSTE